MKLIFTILFLIIYLIVFGQIKPPEAPKLNNQQPKPTNNNQYINRQKQSYNEVQEILNEEKRNSNKSNNTAPDYSSYEFLKLTAPYEQAFNTIKDMLEGKQSLNLKKAVYAVENAYFEGSLSYDKYDGKIKQLEDLVKKQLMIAGYKPTNPLAVNLMIQKVLYDTISYKTLYNEIPVYHYPIRYDFDDFNGEEDYTKMFISKLLFTEKGQCHSMPLLYLIIANDLKTNAYLSFSPNHSYIRFKDKNGMLYNFEATNGCIVSNKWILGSNYINSMAVKNKIYMDTLSLKETIAHMLNDLAEGYQYKYGVADGKFILKCSDLSLQYYPDENLTAIMTKSNTYIYLFYSRMKQRGINNPEYFATKDDEGRKLWEIHDNYWKAVQDLGYMKMPKNAYEQWLNSVEQEKTKPENQDNYIRMHNSIE